MFATVKIHAEESRSVFKPAARWASVSVPTLIVDVEIDDHQR